MPWSDQPPVAPQEPEAPEAEEAEAVSEPSPPRRRIEDRVESLELAVEVLLKAQGVEHPAAVATRGRTHGDCVSREEFERMRMERDSLAAGLRAVMRECHVIIEEERPYAVGTAQGMVHTAKRMLRELTDAQKETPNKFLKDRVTQAAAMGFDYGGLGARKSREDVAAEVAAHVLAIKDMVDGID